MSLETLSTILAAVWLAVLVLPSVAVMAIEHVRGDQERLREIREAEELARSQFEKALASVRAERVR